MTMKMQEGVQKHFRFIHSDHFGNHYHTTAMSKYCTNSILRLLDIYAMSGDIS